jgi:hypothetical protein
MSNITIEWLSDDNDCDTCGTSYAYGAHVRIDGVLVLELNPVAHCYSGTNYEREEVFKAILEYLGHTVED